MKKKNPINLNKIRGTRVEKGLTQAQMADLLGMSTTAYSQKERGEKEFKPSELVDFSRMLGFDVSELFF